MIYDLGDEYFVRPLAEADVDGPYPSWFEDQEVTRFSSHGKFPKNRESFRAYVLASNQEDRVVWAVCHRGDGHIGNVALQQLSFINRTGEFAIVMGDRRHWGKGAAFRASRALVRHGFQRLALERVYCGTAATNDGMKKLALALGMTCEGRRRGHLFLEGQRVDVLEYGVLRTEFLSKHDE